MKMNELSFEEIALINSYREKKKIETWEPKNLESISVDTKIKLFDRLYNFALAMYEHHRENKSSMKDADHYSYEEVMSLLNAESAQESEIDSSFLIWRKLELFDE